LVEQAVSQLRATASVLVTIQQQIGVLVASLSKYHTAMQIFDVISALGSQIIAKIGDVR